MAQIEVVAIFRVKPEAIEQARPQITKLIEETRKEPGNIRYDWYQDAKEPGTFIAIETFANVEAFEAHRHSAHFLEVVEASKAWVTAPPELRVLKPEYVHKWSKKHLCLNDCWGYQILQVINGRLTFQ